MFVELQGVIHNLERYSKLTKESTDTGAGENKIIFWDKTANIEFLNFGQDVSAMEGVWDFLRTATSATSPT